MGTIEEGIGYKKPFSRKLWEKVLRWKLPVFLLLVLAATIFAIARTHSNSMTKTPEQLSGIDLNANIVTNPDASALKLAVVELQIINKQKEPVLSATIKAKYGSSSLSKQVNLPAYYDEKGSKTGKSASEEFWICSENRYKEALKVSFLRQDAQENCLIYDGNSQNIEISVSKESEILASKTLNLK